MVFLFIFGWVFTASFGLTTTSLLFIAIAIALIYVMAAYRKSGQLTVTPTGVESAASVRNTIESENTEDDDYEE